TGDMLFIISSTGRNSVMGELPRIARANGASVMVLTEAGSTLAQASTVSMNIPLPQDTDIYMTMTSRIMQLTGIDVLGNGL
ncbi:SIS domain-containing protein, partial [Pseudomonas syringae pv. tagetis]|uniref:SIS domain-containing protein n=1 Tax=Pseudomonas syringae group genomosp. 7 TaxID=251699 RepID=UPI00377035B4